MLKIYNSKTRRKEEFVPLDPKGERVGLYYCGPTVYDSVHLGHARAAVVPDIVRRYLEHRGYVVRYVANFTDIDDKIIKRSIRERRDWREITHFYMEEYQRILSLLGNRPADVRPRATDHIPEMIDLIERLMTANSAYAAPNGDVYFDTQSFDDYLALSGRTQEDQDSGRSGRLKDSELEQKKHSADFILWKLLSNDPPEIADHAEFVPGWDSPWGKGRPGWHLECSALSRRYLGMPFDIHGGGQDLIFPHHENERAQNDCAYCSELDGGSSVKYWIHNAFVTVKAETEAELADEHTVGDASKMSKSLGNVKWLRDMMWPQGPLDPMAVRMLMLQSHYRSPMQYSQSLLEESEKRATKLQNLVERLRDGLDQTQTMANEASAAVRDAIAQALRDFEAGMDDDFNTPRALAAIDGLASAAKPFTGGEPADRLALAQGLERLCHTLGLRTEVWQQAAASGVDDSVQPALLDLLGELRRAARANKDWQQADRIRDGLDQAGFEVRDGNDGSFEIVPKGS